MDQQDQQGHSTAWLLSSNVPGCKTPQASAGFSHSPPRKEALGVYPSSALLCLAKDLKQSQGFRIHPALFFKQYFLIRSQGCGFKDSACLGVRTRGGQLPRVSHAASKSVVKMEERDFTGGPVVNTSLSNAGDVSSIPGWGAKIPHPSWSKTQNIKQKQHCNKFSKDFRNGLHKKKKNL